jgi:hypothetical protein
VSFPRSPAFEPSHHQREADHHHNKHDGQRDGYRDADDESQIIVSASACRAAEQQSKICSIGTIHCQYIIFAPFFAAQVNRHVPGSNNREPLKWANVRDSEEVLTAAAGSIDTRDKTSPPESSPKLSRRTRVLACSALALEKRKVVMPVCGVSSHRVKRANEGSILIVNRSLPNLPKLKDQPPSYY